MRKTCAINSCPHAVHATYIAKTISAALFCIRSACQQLIEQLSMLYCKWKVKHYKYALKTNLNMHLLVSILGTMYLSHCTEVLLICNRHLLREHIRLYCKVSCRVKVISVVLFTHLLMQVVFIKI